ncbi:MAG TPA: hypothetical protein VIN08_27980 [Ohtaekwangia sp.]|uniref:hypothetical protein n=1 Tax=Ohtaekwangia sp. TaxID=2066019 RepID=UPI002F945440
MEGGINQEARALCVYKDELYVAGEFTEAGKQPAESIARWNGSAWHAVGTGLPNNVFALTEYKGELYAGGTFSTDAADNKKENLFRWDGKQWTGVAIFNGAITSLAVNKDKLCASGYFSHANGKDVSMVAETDGKSWSSVGSPIGYYINRARTAVYILFSHENILYAGGEFREAAGISANGVALYDGSGWKAIGAGADGSIHAFAIYNGELYAAGAFDKAGDVEVGNIVKTTISSH